MHMRCPITQTTLFTFRESVTYKIRKTQRSVYRIYRDVARKNPTKSTSKKVQSRINPKSTKKTR